MSPLNIAVQKQMTALFWAELLELLMEQKLKLQKNRFDEVTVKGSIEDKHTGSNARVGGLIAEVKAVDDKGLKTNTTICNKIDIKK